jgi:hypothetical protein
MRVMSPWNGLLTAETQRRGENEIYRMGKCCSIRSMALKAKPALAEKSGHPSNAALLRFTMKKELTKSIARSKKIRARYHALERKLHKAEWSVEEDALAFLTDAGLVGRLIMSHEGRWPIENTIPDLRHKLGECLWWLIVLSDRVGMDADELLSEFLAKTEK